MARKKKPEDPPPSAPLYMLTYGDMMTLLLCFFVLLFSFSTMDMKKFDHMKLAFNSALGVMPGSKKYIPEDGMVEGTEDTMKKTHAPKDEEIEQMIEDMKKAMKKAMEEEQEMQAVAQEMQQQLKEEIQEKKIEVKKEDDKKGVIIRVSDMDGPKFDLGKAKIRQNFADILDVVAEQLKKPEFKDHRFVVEGHTDKLPISTPEFPSNFDLSTARAMNVLNYLKARGVPEKQLSASGFGEFEPLEEVKYDLKLGAPGNRRVDIVIYKDTRKTPPVPVEE